MSRITWRSAAVQVAIVLAYGAVAILQTLPLVAHLGTHLPGEALGDNVSFVWNIWWMRESLASTSRSFFYSPAILAPLGAPLILHTHTALVAWAGATILRAFTVVQAENLLLIASLALNGWSGYLLARSVGSARLSSFVAGVLLLLSPVVAQRLMGHYNLVAIWPFVLACTATVRWWRQPGWRAAVLVGICAGALPYVDYYLTLYFGAFAAAYAGTGLFSGSLDRRRREGLIAVRVLAALAILAFTLGVFISLSSRTSIRVGAFDVGLRTPTNALTAGWILVAAAVLMRWRWALRIRRRASAPDLRSAAVAGIVAAVIVAPLVPHVWSLWSSGGYVTQQSALRSGPRGVDVATLLMGPPYSGAVGAPVRRAYQYLGIDTIESPAWVGIGVLLLAILAWRARRHLPHAGRWSAIAALFGGWAFGPYLMAFGVNTGLLLPQALIRFLPIVNNARIPGRALIGVATCLVVLAAMAVDDLRRRRRTAVIAVLVSVALVESFAAPLPLAALPGAGVYAPIAADRSLSAVLTIPFGIRDGFGERGRFEPDALYQQTVHGHPLVGGFVARLSPATTAWYEAHEPYASLFQLSAGKDAGVLPDCESAARGLHSAGVGYVVLYSDASGPLRRFVDSVLPTERIGDDGDRTAFVVTGTCPPRISGR